MNEIISAQGKGGSPWLHNRLADYAKQKAGSPSTPDSFPTLDMHLQFILSHREA